MSDNGVAEQPNPSGASSLTAFRCGVLHAFGGFDVNELSGEEQAGIRERKIWFFAGEASMAGMMAATIAVPAGIFFAQKTTAPLAVIGAVVVFLPLFVFLPKILRQAAQVDTEEIIATMGKNQQVKKIFWSLFLAVAGLVLAEIVDPAVAERILKIIAGI